MTRTYGRPNPGPRYTPLLSQDQIGPLHKALDCRDGGRRRQQADIICLLPLAGCCKFEIGRLKWQKVDGNHLRIEDNKTGPRAVLLNRRMREIVEDQLAMTSGEFVPPSSIDPARPVPGDLPLWYEVRLKARLQDVHRHDLHHINAGHTVFSSAGAYTSGC